MPKKKNIGFMGLSCLMPLYKKKNPLELLPNEFHFKLKLTSSLIQK